MRRVIVYVHGSKRVGKTTFSNTVVRLAHADGAEASTASIIAALRNHIKDMYGLTDDHVHGDLKETPLPQFGGVTTRELLDGLVGWHFKNDPSKMCFIRGCMADIARQMTSGFHRDARLSCIQDVIHHHEPPYIARIAEEVGARCIGVHISRPGHTETYGVNMPPSEFDFAIDNCGSLNEFSRKVGLFYRQKVRPGVLA